MRAGDSKLAILAAMAATVGGGTVAPPAKSKPKPDARMDGIRAVVGSLNFWLLRWMLVVGFGRHIGDYLRWQLRINLQDWVIGVRFGYELSEDHDCEWFHVAALCFHWRRHFRRGEWTGAER